MTNSKILVVLARSVTNLLEVSCYFKAKFGEEREHVPVTAISCKQLWSISGVTTDNEGRDSRFHNTFKGLKAFERCEDRVHERRRS